MFKQFYFFLFFNELSSTATWLTGRVSLLSLLALGIAFSTQAQKLDFGDAPNSYGTLLSSDGPRHTPYTRVYLGGSFGSYYDTEYDGQPSILADGDDTHDEDGNLVTNRSDEDGLINGFPAVCLQHGTYSLKVSVYNNSGADATVSAWIDINMNGVFDAGERAQAVVPTTPNLTHYNGTAVTLTWTGLIGLKEGWTYGRIRVASNAAEVANPTGFASSGEVEDYQVHFKDEYDYGDAPASYGTLMKDNGACHLINANVMLLGSLNPTAKDDGQPTVMADGDAGENSVGFPYKLTTAKTSYTAQVNVLNTSGGDAMLCGWIDFNRNGTFDSNERAQAVVAPDTRNLILTWNNIGTMTEGRTYARFRVATNASEIATPTGKASNGSVEDYTLMIEPPQYDFGDAPDSYGTVSGSNGARHIYNDVSTKLCLSNGLITSDIDAETNGQASVQADGDNALAPGGFGSPFLFNDETGLLATPLLATTSTTYSVTLGARNQTGTTATLSGWIDFNRNGTFEANERAQATVPSNSNGNLVQVVLSWNGISGLVAGRSYMRFRIASNADEVADPVGLASDGEVEDYTIAIASASSAMPVTLISFQGHWVDNKGSVLTWVTSWEKNNDRFDVQRSTDARSFETIGRVDGKGNSSDNQSYTFVDRQEDRADLTYYRLRQVDLDGKDSYSKIVAIRRERVEVLSMTVYPNPTTDLITIRLTNGQPKGARVFSINGMEVMNQQTDESLDVRALPAGAYVLEVTTASGSVLRQRFIKR